MDNALRREIVEIARRWVGTSYSHQASLEGVGADCLGLFRGIWREIYGAEPARMPSYSEDWSVGHGDQLMDAAHAHLVPVSSCAQEPGDVVLFRMKEKGPAKHLGILADQGDQGSTFIHSYSLHGVVESALTRAWRRRSVGYFTFPGRNG